MGPLLIVTRQQEGTREAFEGGLTPTLCTLRFDLETALVDEVQGLDGIPAVDDAGDVYFVRPLADHFDVHVALAQGGEHASGDTH